MVKSIIKIFITYLKNFNLCNTGDQWLRVGSPPWLTLLTLVALTFWLEVASSTGVGNSFGFAGHIRDKLGICGPVHAHVTWF